MSFFRCRIDRCGCLEYLPAVMPFNCFRPPWCFVLPSFFPSTSQHSTRKTIKSAPATREIFCRKFITSVQRIFISNGLDLRYSDHRRSAQHHLPNPSALPLYPSTVLPGYYFILLPSSFFLSLFLSLSLPLSLLFLPFLLID